jgi:hypothetical protein
MRTLEQDRERKRKERKLRSHHQTDRKHWLKKAYGITPEKFMELFQKANGCCQICGVHQLELTHNLCVDHDHVTGKIRGLLCKKCNQGLGMFQDSLETLKKARDYLEHSGL